MAVSEHKQNPVKRKYVRKNVPGVFEFVGINARSRNGCLSCRKRSKKCDEKKPICGLCLAKNRECVWPSAKDNVKAKKASNGVSQKVPKTAKPPAPATIMDYLDPKTSVIVTKFPAAGTCSPQITPVDFDKPSSERKTVSGNSLMGITVLTSEEIEELDFSFNQELNGLQNTRRFLNNTQRLRDATQKFNKREINEIRKEERLYSQKKFDRFLSSIEGIDASIFSKFLKVSEEVCLLDARFNILLDIILMRASFSSFLLRCLVALGEMDISESECIQILDEIQVLYSSSNQLEDSIDLLSASLLLAKEIFFGDECLNMWYQFLVTAKDIILKFNLLDNIEKLPDETKFLLSYFCHQDIHSSISYSKGALLDSTTCEQILKNAHCDSYPPCDCLGPLFPTITEVMELSKEAESIYVLLNDPIKINNWVYTEKFNGIIRKGTKLDEKIHLTHPSKNDLRAIKIEEFELHLSLYELYQFAVQLSLRINVKKLAPITPENQIFLVKSINILRFLVHSSLKHSLYYAFLSTGVICVLESDRKEILELLNKCKNVGYSDSLIEKIQIIIKESWARNPDGLLCIDWFQIAEEFGWAMNFV